MIPVGSPARPRQARSLQTEQRLIGAALTLLSQGGLEACQIPDVAHMAGVSVGAVYRRFKDKSALLAAAFRAVLDAQAQVHGDVLARRIAAEPDLEAAFRVMVSALVDAQAQGEPLLVALQTFTRQGADQTFRDDVDAHRRRMLGVMEDQLMAKAGNDASDARRGRIRFALVAMSATLNALMIRGGLESLDWSDPRDRMVEETTAMLVGYVGASDKQG